MREEKNWESIPEDLVRGIVKEVEEDKERSGDKVIELNKLKDKLEKLENDLGVLENEKVEGKNKIKKRKKQRKDTKRDITNTKNAINVLKGNNSELVLTDEEIKEEKPISKTGIENDNEKDQPVIEPEIAQEKVDEKIPEQEEKGREELEEKLLQVDKLLSLYKDRGRFLFHLENLKKSDGTNENEIANAQTKISEINYDLKNLCKKITKSDIEGFPENERGKIEEIINAIEEGKMDYGKLAVREDKEKEKSEMKKWNKLEEHIKNEVAVENKNGSSLRTIYEEMGKEQAKKFIEGGNDDEYIGSVLERSGFENNEENREKANDIIMRLYNELLDKIESEQETEPGTPEDVEPAIEVTAEREPRTTREVLEELKLLEKLEMFEEILIARENEFAEMEYYINEKKKNGEEITREDEDNRRKALGEVERAKINITTTEGVGASLEIGKDAEDEDRILNKQLKMQQLLWMQLKTFKGIRGMEDEVEKLNSENQKAVGGLCSNIANKGLEILPKFLTHKKEVDSDQQTGEPKEKSKFFDRLKEKLGIGVENIEEVKEKISSATKLEDLAEAADLVNKKYKVFSDDFKEDLKKGENYGMLREDYNVEIGKVRSLEEGDKKEILFKFYGKLDKLLKEKEEGDNSTNITEDPEPTETETEIIPETPMVEMLDVEEASEEVREKIKEALISLNGEMKEQFKYNFEDAVKDGYSSHEVSSLWKASGNIHDFIEDNEEIFEGVTVGQMAKIMEEISEGEGDENVSETGEVSEEMKGRIKEAINNLSDNKLKEFGKIIKGNRDFIIRGNETIEELFGGGLGFDGMFGDWLGIKFDEVKNVKAKDFVEMVEEIYDEVKKGEAGSDESKTLQELFNENVEIGKNLFEEFEKAKSYEELRKMIKDGKSKLITTVDTHIIQGTYDMYLSVLERNEKKSMEKSDIEKLKENYIKNMGWDRKSEEDNIRTFFDKLIELNEEKDSGESVSEDEKIGEVSEEMKERMKGAMTVLKEEDIRKFNRIEKFIGLYSNSKNLLEKKFSEQAFDDFGEVTGIKYKEIEGKNIKTKDFMVALKEMYEEVKREKENSEKETDKEKEQLVKDCKSFKELYSVLDNMDEPIKGRVKDYKTTEMKELIEKVRERKIKPDGITKNFGLRRKVVDLINKERSKK